VYNREKYILRFLISIQSQNFKDIEIILIDDCSIDNSSVLIEKYQQLDERIILIKNKKNKGTFICRNIGVLYSKGQYLIIPDPDDIITEGILKYLYNYSIKYNYEMIRFHMYIGNRIIFNNNYNYLKKKVIFQPELSTYLFYGKKRHRLRDFNICNKFIKREAYIRAINNLPKFCLNQYLIIAEDQIMNYILYRTVKSFKFINKIGYYYIMNKQSVTLNRKKISEQRLKNLFIYLKIVIHISKNNKYEKIMANKLFNILILKFNFKKNLISCKKKDKIFYYNIIKSYIGCKYISEKNKMKLKKLMNIILLNKLKK
jgi:glycosyltransferase involved in cell wall biosynthesis